MSAKLLSSPTIWWTSKVTWYFYNNTIIRPSTLRRETDLVYNFYRTATVEAESENREILRCFKVGPNASNASWTTFNSLNVICFVAYSKGHSPERSVSRCTVPKWAPYPKSLESVNNNSWGSEGSQDCWQYVVDNVDQKYLSDLYPILDNLTIIDLPHPSTELILSYKASNLNLAAGIAGDSEIASPTKLASYFLLQKRRCKAQNYANESAIARSFCTF